MLTLDQVHLDTTRWRAHVQTDMHRSYYVDGDPLLLRIQPSPSPELSVEGWRERAERETAAGGGTWLSFDDERIDGCRAFRAVFKFPASRCVPGVEPESLQVYIVGLIVVPLGESHLMINTEAIERGDTGMREAAFGLTQPKPVGDPVPGSIDTYFERFRMTLTMRLPSDAPEVDTLVPMHPLSRVRALQRLLVSEIRLSSVLKALALP